MRDHAFHAYLNLAWYQTRQISCLQVGMYLPIVNFPYLKAGALRAKLHRVAMRQFKVHRVT